MSAKSTQANPLETLDIREAGEVSASDIRPQGLSRAELIAQIDQLEGEAQAQFVTITKMVESMQSLLTELEAHEIHAPARIANAKALIARAEGRHE